MLRSQISKSGNYREFDGPDQQLARLKQEMENLKNRMTGAEAVASAIESLANPNEQVIRRWANETIEKGADAIDAEAAARMEQIEKEIEPLNAIIAERAHAYRCHSSGIPRKDWESMRGSCSQSPALIAAAAFAENDKTILVLSGNPGSGKTFAAGRFLYATTRWPCWFMDVSSLARVSRYESDAMDEIESYSALVIDDLGMEFDDKSGSFRSLLDAIVNARYANASKTLITTNLNADDFKTRYGERIADRIRECGDFLVCAADSFRKKTR